MVHHSVSVPPRALARPGRPLQADGPLAAALPTSSGAGQKLSAKSVVAPADVRSLRVVAPAARGRPPGTQRGEEGVRAAEVLLQGRRSPGTLLRGRPRVAAQAAVLGAPQHPADWELVPLGPAAWERETLGPVSAGKSVLFGGGGQKKGRDAKLPRDAGRVHRWKKKWIKFENTLIFE